MPCPIPRTTPQRRRILRNSWVFVVAEAIIISFVITKTIIVSFIVMRHAEMTLVV